MPSKTTPDTQLSLQKQKPKDQPFENKEKQDLRQRLQDLGMPANDVAFLLNHTDTRGKAVDILREKMHVY